MIAKVCCDERPATKRMPGVAKSLLLGDKKSVEQFQAHPPHSLATVRRKLILSETNITTTSNCPPSRPEPRPHSFRFVSWLRLCALYNTYIYVHIAEEEARRGEGSECGWGLPEICIIYVVLNQRTLCPDKQAMPWEEAENV